MDLIIVNNLEVKKSKIQGVGVFSKNRINKGEVFNICILHELKKQDEYFLSEYHYGIYEEDTQKRFLMLGPPHYYNHSESPNTEVIIKKNNEEIYYMESKSLRQIEPNEEITIFYFEGVKF